MSVRFLSRKEASEYLSSLGLGIAPATLAKYAVLGGGPRFHRYGRQIKYSTDDLDCWARQRLGVPRDSTSDGGKAPTDSSGGSTESPQPPVPDARP